MVFNIRGQLQSRYSMQPTAVLIYLLAICAFAHATGSDVTTSCRQRDAEQRSRDCMTSFNTQVDVMRMSRHKFFTGVDVETIRSICQWFQESVSCIRVVRDQCQWSAAAEEYADNLLRPHWPLFQLCSHPTLFEDYAISQNCFQRVRPHSDQCFADFRQRADSLAADVTSPTADERHREMALQHYCGHLKRLVHCIKSDVRSRCNKMASRLVDVLVDASVELSPLCTDDVINRTTPLPTATSRYKNVNDVPSNGTPALLYHCRRSSFAAVAAFWLLFAALTTALRRHLIAF